MGLLYGVHNITRKKTTLIKNFSVEMVLVSAHHARSHTKVSGSKTKPSPLCAYEVVRIVLLLLLTKKAWL